MAQLEVKHDAPQVGAGVAGEATAQPAGGLDGQDPRRALRGKPYAQQRAMVQPKAASTAGAAPAAAHEAAPAASKPAQFAVLGQRFDTLQEVHDFLQATQPDVPEVVIRLTHGGAVKPRAQTLWHYYQPDQKIVLNGGGGEVNGLHGGRPTLGYFLSYRPVVGTQTSAARPAAANLEVRNLTIRGFQSGGVEISPQQQAGAEHQWDGGQNAFVAGAHIHNVGFNDLGSKRSRKGETDWSKMQFGAGGLMMRGVSGSTIEDCSFEGLENGLVPGAANHGKAGPRLIHAVYLNNQSSGNQIRNNRFKDVSGDPVRVSNGSNDNVVRGNRTDNAGSKALVSAWHNVADPNAPQQASTGTQIGGNHLGSLYGKKRKAARYDEKVSHGQRPDLAV